MQVTRAITSPFGISVFGSSIVRVDPDIASLSFAVSRTEMDPKEAFAEAHEGADSVREFLLQVGVSEIGSSRVSLTQTFSYSGGEARSVGYDARIVFNVLLRDLEKMESLLAGIVDAGANVISPADLQTSQLKAVRAEARRRAVQAAQEKARLFCDAAGVGLGPVIHIEDVNPDSLTIRQGHAARDPETDDQGEPRAFNPESITVAAAVMIAFELSH